MLCYTLSKITENSLPFAACLIVPDEVTAVLVDGVVGEVHIHVVLEAKGAEFPENLYIQFLSI